MSYRFGSVTRRPATLPGTSASAIRDRAAMMEAILRETQAILASRTKAGSP